jgi:hypothetical protein
MGAGGQCHARKEIWYSLYRRLGVSQGHSGQVQKILCPPEFDPRSIQLIASRYTNYTLQAYKGKIIKK